MPLSELKEVLVSKPLNLEEKLTNKLRLQINDLFLQNINDIRKPIWYDLTDRIYYELNDKITFSRSFEMTRREIHNANKK